MSSPVLPKQKKLEDYRIKIIRFPKAICKAKGTKPEKDGRTGGTYIEKSALIERDGTKTLVIVFSLYLLLACAYFYRIFTEGHVVIPGDAYLRNYPVREFFAASIKEFVLPLWNPFEFIGMPFMGAMQPGALYPPNIVLYFLLPAPHAYNLGLLLHHALAGVFTFMYVRLLGPGRVPSFVAGVVFGYSGFMANHTPHIAMINTAVWFPLILYLFEKFRLTKDIRYPLVASLAVAAQVTAGHFQIFLYSGATLSAVLLFTCLNSEKGLRARFLAIGFGSILLGLLIASPYIYSVLELSNISWRRNVLAPSFGYAYYSYYHVYLLMLPTLIFPYIFGSAYGGPQYGPMDGVTAFAGILPLVLAAAAALWLWKRSPHARVWAVVGAGAFLLSLGGDTPLGRLMYHVPVYNLFRGHSRNLFEFTFAVAVLSAIGLQGIFEGAKGSVRYLKAVAAALAAVLVLSVAAVPVSGALDLGPLVELMRKNLFIAPERIAQALDLNNPAFLVPLVFACGYLAWAVLGIFMPGKKFLRLAAAVLIALEAFSYGGFQDKRGVRISEVSSYGSEHSEIIDMLSGGGQMYRVLPLLDKKPTLLHVSKRASYITSYEPLAPEKVNRILNHHTEWISNPFHYSYDYLLRNNQILSMLNVRYITVPKSWDTDLPAYEKAEVFTKPRLKEPSAIRPVWTDNAEPLKDGYLLSRSNVKLKGSALMSVELKKGVYRLSFRTESLTQERPFVSALLFEPPYTDGGLAAHVYPVDIGGNHYGIFGIEKPAQYLLAVFNEPPGVGGYEAEHGPIKVTGIKVERLDGYAPPALDPAAGKNGSRLYVKKFETLSYDVFENTNALPRAYSVSRLVPAGSFSDVKRMLDLFEINVSNEAILYEEDLRDIGRSAFAKGEVSIKKYGLHRVEIEADLRGGDGFVVLSDQHYPGWRAFVDGEETTIYETNGMLRGVVVPEGRHEVTFRYLPYGIFALMGLGAALALGIVVYLIFSSWPLLRGPGR